VPGAFHDFDLLAERLTAEVPVWEPGTTHGYHAITIGVIEGELVRRITGRTIGTSLRDEVARPLDDRIG
jgi:CubicO group peptidase (beta-lactamase class C family)